MSIEMIAITRRQDGDPLRFEVNVHGRGSFSDKTEHKVTMAAATFARLTIGYNTPENVVGAAFRFLLDREPPESILPAFDISEIPRYFPEFERELPRYLPKTTKD
jgi:hypothetical protein